MGMSADFETAIRFGATHVRVGSAIFGERALADFECIAPGADPPARSISGKRQRDAAFGGAIIFARHMQEDRAACAIDHRIVVEAEHRHHIV